MELEKNKSVEDAARAFLSESDDKEQIEIPDVEPANNSFDETAARDFLSSKEDSIAEPDPALDPEQESGEKSILESAGDFATAANTAIITTLGIPADAANWVLEKVGAESRILGGSKDIQTGMSKLNLAYKPGEEPNTVSYKAGEYTGMGLTFLAPWLRMGKGAAEMTAAPVTVTRGKAVIDEGAGFFKKAGQKAFGKRVPTSVTGIQAVQEGASVLTGISQRISAPFVNAPKTALTAEVTASTGAAVMGEKGKEYGPTGEIIGNVIGGVLGGFAPHAAIIPNISRYAKKALFPYTKAGGDIKASNRLRTLAETVNVEKNILENEKKVMAGSNLSPAKLSGDRHLEGLEKRLRTEDSAIDHKFRQEESRVNEMARKEVEQLGGNIRIEETQAYMKGRVDRIKDLINLRMRKAAITAQDKMVDLPPAERRKVVNEVAGREIDAALDVARKTEKDAWSAVDQNVISATDETKTIFRQHLDAQESTSDSKNIPKYLRTFLGDVDKTGKTVEGKIKSTATVGELQVLRSRINGDIRELKAADAPKWNRIRIMNDIQEGILKDLEKSPNSKNWSEAISISREVNEKFSGGIMDSILGHEKTGGKLASELTLEGINNGPKAAVEAKRILAASPKSLDAIEEYVKIQIAQSSVIKDGRISLKPAKKYMAKNEELMNIFPDLKNAMNQAIAGQEKSEWLNKIGKKAIAKANSTFTAQLSQTKPKTFLSTVMESPNQEKTMEALSKHLNDKGKAGIKHDITDFLLRQAKTAEFDDSNMPILSGRKFSYELEKNMKTFSKVMNEGELGRLQVVAETMIKNEGMGNLPKIDSLIPVEKNPLGIALEFLAAKQGPGNSLKATSMRVALVRKIMSNLDVGRATQLIKDALQDPVLFRELISDHKTEQSIERFSKVFHGWMAASAIENISENN